ncbi:MAG: NIPSNAP family protein, partial [Candidatus Binatia bacterium]
VHVWPYESLQRRAEIRAQVVKEESRWPPKVLDLIETMEAEIFLPAPFMQPLPNQRLGNVYEMRTYLYRPGTMAEVLKRWAEAVPQRVQLSPLVACLYSEIGELNKFVHIWAYQDLEERDRIRAESLKLPQWPPNTREFMVSQANKILLSAAFSPL